MEKCKFISRILAIAIALVVFGIIVNTGEVCANDEGMPSIKSSSEVISLVNEQYITSSICALEDMGETNVAALWKGASAGEPILQWTLGESGDRIIPLNWVCPIQNGGTIVGLVGVDPYTGVYSWRIDKMPPQYMFPSIPGDDTLKGAVAQSIGEEEVSPFNYSDVKLVLVNHMNYWLIPTTGADMDCSAVVPVDDLSQADYLAETRPTMGVLTSSNDSDRYASQLQIGGRFEDLFEQARESMTIQGDAFPQSLPSYTWMKDYVPYYWQDGTHWCGPYSLAMVHQWWSPVSCGTGSSQATAIANWLGINSQQGINDFQAIDTMRGWHSINPSYESWPGSGWVNFDPIALGDPTWQTNDIKSWIALDVPVIACIDAYGEGGWANHFVVVVGYNDNDFGGSGGIYVNDPAHWLGWPSAQPSVNYGTFNSDYWRLDTNVMKYEVGIVGFPGDFDYVDTSVSLKNVPSAIYDDEVAQPTIEMTITSDNTASTPSTFGEWCGTGLHFRTTSTNGVSGNGIIRVASTGGFKEWDGYQGRGGTKVCSSSSSSSGEAKIFEFYTDSNPEGSTLSATFTVKPTDVGAMTISFRSWAYDQDDRIHYSDPNLMITVFEDKDYNVDGTLSMPKPVIWLGADPFDYLYGNNYLDYSTYSRTITVNDDDTVGPAYSNLKSIPSSPVYDSHSGSIRLQGDVSDASGVYSVQFMIEYTDEPGMPCHYHDPSGHSGNTYWYDIPRDEWVKHVGATIEWQVKATDNDSDRESDRLTSWSGWHQVEIESVCVSPGTPSLVSPSNGQTVSTTPSLDWGDVSGATSYDVEVCSDSGCTSVVRSVNVGSSQWTVSPALNEGVTYYWHARAKNSCGPGLWSSIRSLTTQGGCVPPGTPSLVSPPNGETVSTTPSLDWSDVSGATSYDVEVCSDSDCTSVVRSDNVGSSQWTVSPALSEGATYYWHARARNSCGPSSWSSIRSFTTQGGCVLPGTPSLVSPSNGETVSTTPSLDWSDVSGATSYNVEVCSDSGCTSVVRSVNVGSSQWTVSPALNEGVTYYWHARARNSCGPGSWSSIRSFTTSSIPPTPDLIPAGIAFNVNSAVHRVWINWDEDLLAQAQIDWWLEAGANLDPSDVNVISPSGTNPNGGVYGETIKTKDTIDNVPCIEIQAWRSGDIQIFVRITYDGYDWTLHTEKKWGELHHTILDVDAKTTAVEHIKQVEFGTDEVYYEETLKDTVWAEFLYLSGTVLVDDAIVHWWLVEDTDANQAWVDAFMDYLAAHGGGLDDDHWAAHGAYMMSDLGGREPWEYINDWVCGPDEIANTTDDRAVDPSLFYWSAVDVPGQIDATGNTRNWYAWAETDDGMATATLSVDVDGLAPCETYEVMTVVLVSYPSGSTPQDDPFNGEISVCLEKGKIEFHKISVNNPPNTPSSPSPLNHATGVSVNTDLSWTGGDFDVGDTVTYDVYFGTSSSPPLVSNDQSGTMYDPGTLAYTKYYWKIIATDNHGASTAGPLWDFSTVVVPGATATRDLPAAVKPGEQFDVGIVASGCGFAGQLKETLPVGFTYVSCDPGIVVSQSGQEVRFTFISDGADFSYTVLASAAAAAGTYTFAGVVMDQDLNQSTVGGDTCVTVGGPWDYDENHDGIFQKSEALQAVLDYFDLKITKAQVLEVLLLYFSQ